MYSGTYHMYISIIYILFLYLLFINKDSMPESFVFETGSHYVAQTGLELTSSLPQSPKHEDYRCVPPCQNKIYIIYVNVL
jgi:hypothetical protein